MSATPINEHIKPIAIAIDQLRHQQAELEGMVILAFDKKGDYDFYVAGTVSAERTIGVLEIVKAALLKKVDWQ